jgi:hypothetical protein
LRQLAITLGTCTVEHPKRRRLRSFGAPGHPVENLTDRRAFDFARHEFKQAGVE